MRDLEREARSYLTPPVGAFWHWGDAATVIELRNGATVAFDAELVAVLRRLATGGLPPLSSVVLLLAATRTAWHADSRLMSTLEPLWLHGSEMVVERASRLFAGLDRVTLLDAEVRAPLRAKVAIAELVLENVPRKTDPRLARAVVDLLENRIGDMVPTGPIEDDRGEIELEIFEPHHLLSMVPGLDAVTPERIALRMRTGLDELVGAADVELPLPEQVRALLAKLEQDDELAGLAGLARNLMAAVTLPRPVSEPDELPLGGVSDITNRGPLDRLLLSELAHDDLTLSVRVAVGEALYLRRESPPKAPPRQRSLLLDAGLRTWGLPRVFAAAVALAFAATSDRNAEFVVRRAHGKAVAPVDLATREGLIQHLGALATDLHPGDALEAFCRELPPAAAEPLIVTTVETLDDPKFVAALRRQPLAPLFLAGVNRAGDFVLFHDTGRGRKPLRRAQLELESLTHSRPKHRAVDRGETGDLPAIFSVVPFPLLLPHPIDARRSWVVEDHGVLVVTKDRRLLHYTRPGFGARQLSDAVPKGGLQWFTTRAENLNCYAVVGSLQTARLHLLEVLLDRGHCEATPLVIPPQPLTAVCSHNGALMAIGPKTVEVFEMATGRRIQSLPAPSDMKWQRGRLFSSTWGLQHFVLSFDGQSAQSEPALGPSSVRCPKLLTLFEREGIDGPIGVTARGDLFFTAKGELKKVDHEFIGPVQVLAVAHDGRRVVLGHVERPPFSGRRRAVIDVDTLTVHRAAGDPLRLAEPDLQRFGPPPTLRNRFVDIYVSSLGELTLTARRQYPLAIVPDAKHNCIRFVPPSKVDEAPNTRRRFKLLVGNASRKGYWLEVARWDNGSQAVLDSRGLLHLVSGDKSVPEVTLVLYENELSGWCSDGRMWGNRYFIGDAPAADSREVFETAIKPFVQRLA